MSQQIPHEGTEGSELHRFERNEYFHGKLMTARDMEAEQAYHRGRLEAVARHVSGGGLVCGLSATLSERNRRLEATIDPGLAVDRYGHLVVVASEGPYVVTNDETGEATLPKGDDVYLFLEYAECSVESVPVPGGADGCEERCCHNRVVETFDVVYREEAPTEYKTVADVDFPDREQLSEHGGSAREHHAALTEMARSYYEGASTDCQPDEFSLFLGHYEKQPKDETWDLDPSPDFRSFLYTNDMLYAILAAHVTDFDDPHRVEALKSLNEVSNPNGNVDLDSPNETISIVPDQNADKVNLEVAGDVAREDDLDELRVEIRRLRKELEELREKCDVEDGKDDYEQQREDDRRQKQVEQAEEERTEDDEKKGE